MPRCNSTRRNNAETYRLSTDLTIVAADVNGQDVGISAIHNGSGALSITATGAVTGRIFARNYYGTDTTIDTAAVYGNIFGGISAVQKGDGDPTITATGPVVGGISAEGRGTNTISISIEATTVSDGINADLRAGGGGSVKMVEPIGIEPTTS